MTPYFPTVPRVRQKAHSTAGQHLFSQVVSYIYDLARSKCVVLQQPLKHKHLCLASKFRQPIVLWFRLCAVWKSKIISLSYYELNISFSFSLSACFREAHASGLSDFVPSPPPSGKTDQVLAVKCGDKYRCLKKKKRIFTSQIHGFEVNYHFLQYYVPIACK